MTTQTRFEDLSLPAALCLAPPRAPAVTKALRRACVRPGMMSGLGVLVPIVPMLVGLVVAAAKGMVVQAGCGVMVVVGVGLLLARDRLVERGKMRRALRGGQRRSLWPVSVVPGRTWTYGVTRVLLASDPAGAQRLGWVTVRGRATIDPTQPLTALVTGDAWVVLLGDRLHAGDYGPVA